MWHKTIWKGHPMRLELTCVGLLVELANHYTTRGTFPPPIYDADQKYLIHITYYNPYFLSFTFYLVSFTHHPFISTLFIHRPLREKKVTKFPRIESIEYVCVYNWKKTQTRLNCHYKFILAKNIIFISSDDIHTWSEGEHNKRRSYSSSK